MNAGDGQASGASAAPRDVASASRLPAPGAGGRAASHAPAVTPAAAPPVRGMGARVHSQLVRHLRGEDALRDALRRGDVHALTQVPGVTERKAAAWVRAAQAPPGSAAQDTFLATAAARKVHEDVLERLLGFCATTHGRNRLRLMAPLASPQEATAHAARVMQLKEEASRLDRDAVRKALRRLKAPSDPAPRRSVARITVCETAEIQDRLEALGVAAWVHLAGLESLAAAQGYETVVFLYEDGADLDGLEHVLELPGDASLAQVAPEKMLAWFAHNRGALEGCAELGRLFARPSPSAEALALLGEAQVAQATPQSLRAAVEQGRRRLELELRARLAAVSLRGDELMAQPGRAPAAVQQVVDACLREARAELQRATGLSFQPYSALPVEVDEEEVDRVEEQLAATGRMQALRRQMDVAVRLEALQAKVQQELAGWLDFDAPFALGCFALEHDLRPARFGDRLECHASVHLDLAGRADAQRIHYALGGEHPVAVLTGANSGGKTTLLEHLAQLTVMARHGLPVVGEATVPWVDEVHYVTNRRSLDAGAFESFLRSFLPLADDGPRRLVLADEVESMTELEAAGRILGFFLDRVAARGGLTLLVTHMAGEVLRHTTARVRVDGIEATGLDDRFRLVVDRTPRMGHRARSTPELIVQRIAATSRGPEQQLYRDLLQRFRGPRPSPAVAPDMPSHAAPPTHRPLAAGLAHPARGSRRGRPLATTDAGAVPGRVDVGVPPGTRRPERGGAPGSEATAAAAAQVPK